ncbi:hypothetical protein AB3X89_08010 [Paraburkholderia sp. BR14320]|uniref:hypothetical protein n=1 Tax=unclassified Paraburkholderia TaxID=2615204 RepID=UPI0034CE44B6
MTDIVTRQPDRLFRLLPALYQIADAAENNALRALLGLITSEADALRANTQQLWDDFFIETCQPWVIPYIGELIANLPLHDLDLASAAATAEATFTDLAGPGLAPASEVRLRADVAQTIYYRRRKGTPSMLEKLAQDVTGWGAHLVEFFTLLDWNQNLEHVRPACHGTPELRRVDAGDRAGGAWDTATHTVDVREIGMTEGWYNIPNIGFFLFRLKALRLTRCTPRKIGTDDWRRTFSPLGQNCALFTPGGPEDAGEQRTTELTVPAPIRPAAFFEDVRSLPLPPLITQASAYYGDDIGNTSSFAVYEDGALIPASDVRCANLEPWLGFAQPADKVLVDVARGRMMVPSSRKGVIIVSWFHGFSARMGGGEYERGNWLVVPAPGAAVHSQAVSGGDKALATALAAPRATSETIFEIGDSATYHLNADITLAPGERLIIQAADEHCPLVILDGGSIALTGGGALADEMAGLTLGGLIVEGGLRVEGDLGLLRLLHTTLVPGRSVEQLATLPPTGPSVVVSPGPAGALINTRLELQFAFSITGALRVPAHAARLMLLDSIVDGIEQDGAAVSDAAGTGGPPAHIERSTLIGTARFLKLELASESIFTDVVEVDERQQGCVRFSWLPWTSRTPQQYRCQPALEIARQTTQRKEEAARTGVALPSGWEALLADAVNAWLKPAFTSVQYGAPGFAQLGYTCPKEIRTGAQDGSEMGAFCVLKQPLLESNLRIRLDEYLPVGLSAGLIYMN